MAFDDLTAEVLIVTLVLGAVGSIIGTIIWKAAGNRTVWRLVGAALAALPIPAVAAMVGVRELVEGDTVVGVGLLLVGVGLMVIGVGRLVEGDTVVGVGLLLVSVGMMVIGVGFLLVGVGRLVEGDTVVGVGLLVVGVGFLLVSVGTLVGSVALVRLSR